MRNISMGIRPKLLAAFGLVLGMTLIACTISLYAFNRVGQSLGEITQESVPFMERSMELTQLGTRVSSSVPLLSGSKTVEDATSHYHALQEASLLIEKLLNQKAIAGGQSKTDDENIQDVLLVRGYMEDLNAKVLERVEMGDRAQALEQEINSRQLQVNQELLVVINQATLDFVVMAENIFARNHELIDSLLHEYVLNMVSALKLQGYTAEMTSLLSSALKGLEENQKILDKQNAAELANRMSIERENLHAEFLQHPEEIYGAIDRLQQLATGEKGIYAERDRPLSRIKANGIIRELQAMEVSLFTELSPVVDESYKLMFAAGEELDNSVTLKLPKFMNEGVEHLVNMLQLRAELNTVSGILLQAPFVSDEVALEPLEARYKLSRDAIDAALLNTPKDLEELQLVTLHLHELTSAASANGGVFNARKSELATISEIVSLEKVLGSTQARVVDRLLDQVQESRSRVDAASSNVAGLIQSSRVLLLVVSVLSVSITLLVFWLLVSKGILARLLETVSALRALADGDYSVSVNCAGSDELSDLARTVEIFRKNGLEAQSLQEEQGNARRERQAADREQAEKERKEREEQTRRHESEQIEAARKGAEAKALQERVDGLLAAVNAAAQGNLNHPINTSGDDLAGQMGRALDTLFSELRDSMEGINANASQLTRASDGLSMLSVEMNELASANTRNAQEASGLTNDVGSNVDSVAGATEEMSSSIKEIARNTTEAETVAVEAVALAKSTDVTVRKLAESSAGIGSVIKVITSIAEQTNLLALNATIEAARAGDAGKGFAVVANEVKELAKETARATEQIESRISEIQTDTDSAVEAIEAIGGIIGKISNIQSTIAVAIDEQSSVTQEISRSIGQTATGSEAISSLIEGVAEKALSNQQASDGVSTAAGELSDTAVQLQKLVLRYAGGQDDSARLKAA